MSSKLKFNNPLTSIYDEAKLAKDVRTSLTMMLFGNICGNAFGIICGSSTTAMVGLATVLGADDLAFGIISAIVQLAAVMQIPFAILVNRTQKRKHYLLTWGIISRMIWMIFGFIPFLAPTGSINLRLWSLIFLLGISSALGAMINVSWFPWFSDLCPDYIRGRWFSIRDIAASICNILFGFLVAFLLDYLPEPARYTVVFLLGGLVGTMDMLCFAPAKEVYSSEPSHLNFVQIVKDIIKNKPFFNFMLMWAFWNFTWFMDSVFMTPYSMNVMGLNAMQIMIFSTIAGGVATVLAAYRWGRALFHFGDRSVLTIACIGGSACHLFYLFSSPGNVLPTFLFNFIGALFWSGSNLACNSMQLSLSPDDERPSYIAVFSCIVSFVGITFGSLVGGWALNRMEALQIGVGYFDRYKILFLVSTALRMLGLLYFLPRLDNPSGHTAKELLHSMFRIKKHA